ncbi:hypothetical protein A8C56_09090 [Niabella ginsenosidivorans]|uniref:Uncharacterized protein n=1 Tax=Niabella ginsenosidivorans TaxID=1176587 RepID=A0A1A9I0S4_9BACT|nr:DUF4091 domain-containing protein [Niabella ginsenosidivorans]ANH81113.1 hypothetical protein A8C56_09090 [Niabella ginsenosidivorans]
MRYLITTCLILIVTLATAQDVSLALQKEPPMSAAQKAVHWKALDKAVHVSFANSNKRYAQDRVPQIAQKNADTMIAWKGEKIHTQVAVWAAKDMTIDVAVNDLEAQNGARIAKESIDYGFVGYVMTDEFRNGCGYRKPEDFDSSLVADVISSNRQPAKLSGGYVQPVWVSITVPPAAKAGYYTGTLTVKADKAYDLKLVVKVLDRTLPPPSEWAFHLDLWQHPAAVARVHHVPLWSDAHFNLMRKYYTMLANAGQKYITASIVNEPWGHQTYDDYPGLIKWKKKKDGSWNFDYSLFDKYIAFVMSTGINERINCYSMVPWKVAFQYYDENSGKDTVFTGKIGSDAYNAFWAPMLKDFTAHLKQKGWFEKTAIAMDERPMEAMQSVIRLLKGIDKDWKIALAGEYHTAIEKDIDDYCIASAHQFPDSILKERELQHKLSTWYTCCTEKYPNGFTFSPPAEHVWIGWYTAAKNMNGYLRWAYNSWVQQPLMDSRFRTWPAGDTYQVYPGPQSSIRFEKLIEGIQDFEKINILKKEYRQNGQTEKLRQLEAVLKTFEIPRLEKESAEQMVVDAKRFINE